VYGVVPAGCSEGGAVCSAYLAIGEGCCVITSVPPEVVTVRNVELAHPVDAQGLRFGTRIRELK